jgi:hypothetical protein
MKYTSVDNIRRFAIGVNLACIMGAINDPMEGVYMMLFVKIVQLKILKFSTF